VTAGASKDTLVAEYNDAAGLEQAFAAHGDRIAAVILEPVVGNMGVVRPTGEFVMAVNRLTKRHGALLICDEVMSGFRVAFAGAQAVVGFTPDLTTLGKIVGGGLPVGAYGGRRDVMDHVLPCGKVFQAGTLSGNPLATAAGCAMLRVLKEQPPYERLERLSARLADGLHRVATSAGVAHTISRVGSMMTLFFHDGAVRSWKDASQCDTARFAHYFWGLLNRGVYMPCSQYEALFVSAAHTEADIDATIAAAEAAFAQVATK
jgi:glutamate-1-semialdehyde 2,1-aminomutase